MGLVICICLILTAFVGLAETPQKPVDQQRAESKMSDPIPVEKIAIRAAEISGLLKTLRSQYADTRKIDTLKNDFSDASDQIARQHQNSVKVLQSQSSLDRLKGELRLWQDSRTRMAKWLDLLTQRAILLQSALNQLSELRNRWLQTLHSATKTNAPETIIQQIRAVLSVIETESITVQAKHNATIELQSAVAEKAARCEEMLAEISKAQQMARGALTDSERLPIWKPELWQGLQTDRFGRLGEVAVEQWADLGYYLRDPARGMPFHFLFFGVLVVLFNAMRRQVNRWPTKEDSTVIAIITDSPLLGAIIGVFILASSPYSAAPPAVRNLFFVLMLAAMIRMTAPAVDRWVVHGFYTIWLLFAFDTVQHALSFDSLFGRILIMIETLAGLAALGWSMAFGSLQRYFSRATGSVRERVSRAGALLVLVLLGAGLIAGILGYTRFARLMVSGVLISSVQALTLYAGAMILLGITSFCFRVRPLRLLRLITNHRPAFENKAYRIFIWAALVGWFIRVLDYLGLLQPVLAMGDRVLSLTLARGTFSLSLADVLAFALTVWVTFQVSAFIRLTLEEDVYPRKALPRGVAYAASQLIHYTILTLGFLAGIGMLGMDLTKVTVLISAFSVGIGFGLQGVVNNFVSGLVLLFERPIHIGDTIEMGNLRGQVRRMGLRSSIVRNRQGAEIIVPNSHLVSEQVTNWTYSDQMRRIELPVGVNYGATPQNVIEVLEFTANANPKILKDPPPQALLSGFGDSAINFELWAWIESYADWAQIRSQLAVDVYNAIRSAGFSFPFPQREVRLLDTDET